MPALRCSSCAVNWPLEDSYAKWEGKGDYKRFCPLCLQRLDRMENEAAMKAKDAGELAARGEFERRYRAHDQERERRGDPSPEAVGALEAKQIAKLNRATGVWRRA